MEQHENASNSNLIWKENEPIRLHSVFLCYRKSQKKARQNCSDSLNNLRERKLNVNLSQKTLEIDP